MRSSLVNPEYRKEKRSKELPPKVVTGAMEDYERMGQVFILEKGLTIEGYAKGVTADSKTTTLSLHKSSYREREMFYEARVRGM